LGSGTSLLLQYLPFIGEDLHQRFKIVILQGKYPAKNTDLRFKKTLLKKGGTNEVTRIHVLRL